MNNPLAERPEPESVPNLGQVLRDKVEETYQTRLELLSWARQNLSAGAWAEVNEFVERLERIHEEEVVALSKAREWLNWRCHTWFFQATGEYLDGLPEPAVTKNVPYGEAVGNIIDGRERFRKLS